MAPKYRLPRRLNRGHTPGTRVTVRETCYVERDEGETAMPAPSDLTTTELLTGTALFAELNRQECTAVTRHSSFRDLSEGDYLFREGEPAERFFVIQRGEILIQQREDEQRTRDVARYIAGESFGELDVVRESTRSAAAAATGPTRILEFPAPPHTFSEVLTLEPASFAPVLQKLIAALAGRIRSTNKMLSDNSAWVHEVRRQVYTDKLTGLYNTTYLKDQLKTFPPAEQTGSVLFSKPDRFKEINDTYGHEVGDHVIQLLARLFYDHMKPHGAPVRYRGNEMVVLLAGYDLGRTRTLARELRDQIAKIDITPYTGGEDVTLSSIQGISESALDDSSGDDLLQKAYTRLYRAREDGGDRVYDPETEPTT
jgi:diguanylate cyclase (GGDEF)-like protein